MRRETHANRRDCTASIVVLLSKRRDEMPRMMGWSLCYNDCRRAKDASAGNRGRNDSDSFSQHRELKTWWLPREQLVQTRMSFVGTFGRCGVTIVTHAGFDGEKRLLQQRGGSVWRYFVGKEKPIPQSSTEPQSLDLVAWSQMRWNAASGGSGVDG